MSFTGTVVQPSMHHPWKFQVSGCYRMGVRKHFPPRPIKIDTNTACFYWFLWRTPTFFEEL